MSSAPGDAFAQFAASLRWSDVDAAVRDRMRVTVRDFLACAVNGAGVPFVSHALSLISSGGAGGASCVVGSGVRTNAGAAAFGMALAAASGELDETHFLMRVHPAIHVVPVALAVGENMGASVAQVLGAVLVGYEVAARMGRAVTLRPGVHAHGSFGLTGGAIAAALLYGATPSQLAAAVDLAASTTSASVGAAREEGAEVYHAYFATACERAVSLGVLACSGVEGSPSALQSVFGTVLGTGIDLGYLTAGLGDAFAVETSFIKTIPVCADLHATAVAVENALDGYRLDPDSVHRVIVRTFRSACETDCAHPDSPVLARFSLPWVVASLIVNGRLDDASFTTEALTDERVRKLAKRVTAEVSEASSEAFPERLGAQVEIVVESATGPGFSSLLRGTADLPSATALWPDEDDRTMAKARALLGPVVDSPQAVFDVLNHDDAPIADLIAACRPLSADRATASPAATHDPSQSYQGDTAP